MFCFAGRCYLLSLTSIKMIAMRQIWTDIATSLKEYEHMNFKENHSQRAVRERFALLHCKFKEKENKEIRASGISPEQDDLDVLLEEIIERGKVAKENSNFASEKKEKNKATGEEIRKQALKRMGQTKIRISQDEGEWAVKEREREGAEMTLWSF